MSRKYKTPKNGLPKNNYYDQQNTGPYRRNYIPQGEQLFSVQGIDKYFFEGNEKTYALKNLDMEIYRGEFTCISGSNGSGKTTLINILGGILGPEQGKVYYCDYPNGTPLDYSSSGKDHLYSYRINHVSWVFQNLKLISHRNAFCNVTEPLMLRGYRKSEAIMRAEDLFREFSASHLTDKYPHQLSGGQKQIIAVIRALTTQPSVILADEPTANLDEKNKNMIMKALKMAVNRGTSVVMISHDIEFANKYCTDFFYLKKDKSGASVAINSQKL